MADMLDYLKWRGDILFSQLPLNSVDALIFSTLAYVKYDGIVPEEVCRWITLEDAARNVLDLPDLDKRIRVKRDIELLEAVLEAPRFRRIGLSFYQNVLIPEEETQFSAVTFFLEDGSAFLAFRGTDYSLTGWKEDFNMSFQESVPAQRLAVKYLQDFCEVSSMPLRLGGHSKGGNLAVYAAAKCDTAIQERIIEVYNEDGPGFMSHLIDSVGYQNVMPKIRTYIPQSSVVGMLLEHEEPYIVIKSKQIGVLQHDPYSWEVMGKDFIYVEEVSEESKFLDKTIKAWMMQLSAEERNKLVDTVFELLATGDAETTKEMIRPRNLVAYVKTLKNDDELRRFLAGELTKLIRTARKQNQEEKQNLIEKQNLEDE